MKWRDEVGGNASRLIPRLQAETDDVLAALDYLRTLPAVDMKRIGIMGWSFGGDCDDAGHKPQRGVRGGGGSSRRRSYLGQQCLCAPGILVAAAGKSMTPTLFMVAKNDRTTRSITAPAEVFNARNIAHRTVIYAPFTPARAANAAAPGHALFSAQGASVWEADVVRFLGQYLGTTASDGAAAGAEQRRPQ